ncbi:MAG: hypothetical protein D6719_01980, partial [Candidatus Dadabacteria bacterium]
MGSKWLSRVCSLIVCGFFIFGAQDAFGRPAGGGSRNSGTNPGPNILQSPITLSGEQVNPAASVAPYIEHSFKPVNFKDAAVTNCNDAVLEQYIRNYLANSNVLPQ